jgi:mRNA-degrading endonuclease RelE of RelBE toxin-antitoxin system
MSGRNSKMAAARKDGPWHIKWTHRALKDLDSLDHQVARRILRKLEGAAAEPARFFSRLAGSDDHKLRIGDFRLLALLSHDTATILVERVDHRSRIYERRG